MCFMQIFSKPNDEIGLIAMGTNATSNQLNSSIGGYDNISVLIELALSNWNMIRTLENEIVLSTKVADWFDALIVAMDFLRQSTLYKILLFLTFIVFVIFKFHLILYIFCINFLLYVFRYIYSPAIYIFCNVDLHCADTSYFGFWGALIVDIIISQNFYFCIKLIYLLIYFNYFNKLLQLLQNYLLKF